MVDLEKAREFGRRSMELSESCRRNVRELFDESICDCLCKPPAATKGACVFRACRAGLSATVPLGRSTGVFGRNTDGGLFMSVLEGGRSERVLLDFTGDGKARIAGKDRFCLRS